MIKEGIGARQQDMENIPICSDKIKTEGKKRGKKSGTGIAAGKLASGEFEPRLRLIDIKTGNND